MSEKQNVGAEELERQEGYALRVYELLAKRYPGGRPAAFVRTFGCQENEADSERLTGLLLKMGYEKTERSEDADFILLNTCAVREHAEDRVYGTVGALKRYKTERTGLILALCGCMMQQEGVREKIRKNYPFVDMVFGTHVLYRLPELIFRVLSGEKQVVCAPDEPGRIAERLPVCRGGRVRAWLPVMYGCDNFCAYCVVPLVRGRERSREPEDVLTEAKSIVAAGYKDIILLGQNVNSYGKNNRSKLDFAGLLREVNALDGDFTLRFMTSHPKDCTSELLDAMAGCEKAARHLHLPVQSGSDRVLRAMNRRYGRAGYLELVSCARERMPDISLTSDVIVGFPGETDEDFRDTLSLVSEAEFTSLFTFIFSPREGTAAAELPDDVPRAEKVRRLKALCDLQGDMAARRTAAMQGRVYRVLVEAKAKNGAGLLLGRTGGNVVIAFPGAPSFIGTFQDVRVTHVSRWTLTGELIKD